MLLLLIFIKNGVVGKPLGKYAETVWQRCGSAQFTPSCYDEEIPRLMDEPARLSMEEAFAVTRIIQEKDPKYAYCHVLGHKPVTVHELAKPVWR